MSLTLALRTALSGISVNQVALDVTAGNITNANTPGYTKKEAQLATQTLGTQGYGGGVQVASIVRQVSDILLQEIRKQSSSLSYDKTVYDYYRRTENLFGKPGSEASLSGSLNQLERLFESLAVDPNDPIRQIELIEFARGLTQQIQESAGAVQSLRLEVEREIATSVDIVNAELKKIAELNEKISRNSISGLPTGDLEDIRDEAVKKIAEQLDIQSFKKGNNELVIYTTSGLKLLDNTPQFLEYDPLAVVNAASTIENGSFSSINFKDSPLPGDLADSVRNGKLKGLLDLRDTLLPQIADQLENITRTLVENINTMHNQGTAYPPPSVLNGTRPVNGTDPFFAEGGLRIAITDNDGNFVDYVDIDLATTATGSLDDFITAVNGIATTELGGVAFNTLANISIVDGKIRLEALNGNRIAIGQAAPPATAPTEKVTGSDKGISAYFGLNDFFTVGTSSSDAPKLISDTTVSLATPFAGTGSVRLSVTNPDGTTASAFDLDLATLPVGGTINDLLDEINAQAGLGLTASLGSDGRIRLIPDNPNQNVKLQLLNPPATESTSGKNFVAHFGFSDPRHMSASVSINQTLVQSPQNLARGTLNNEALTPPLLNPVSAITAGDKSIAQGMADSFNKTVAFGKTGSLSSINTSLTNYSALFVANTARQTNTLQEAFLNQNSLFNELMTRNSAISGVDIEQEMANLILLENAYNAAAQVLRVTNEMFDTLSRLLG